MTNGSRCSGPVHFALVTLSEKTEHPDIDTAWGENPVKPVRKLNRRSFLARVAGGAFIAGGALTVLTPAMAQTGITDRDPSDRVGFGRGGGTGITDTDSGVGADPAGRGRGGSRPGSTGVTDSDPSDPVGRGRGGSGITDSDTGPYADPRGRGRGGVRGPGGNNPYDPAGREERCENNRRLYAELSRDGPTPDTWSEGQLRVAQADLQAANGAIAAMRQTSTTDSDAQRAWAVIEPIARRYGIPVTRQGTWYSVTSELDQLIYRAQSSPIRAERMRRLQQARNNLAALGC